MDSNKKFRGNIVKNLIKNRGLTKQQAKKLICIGSITDAHVNIYPDRAQWYLETNPEKEIHNLFYDLFLYSYNLKLPIFYYNTKKYYRRSGLIGKKYKPIVEDLLKFSPTFKTTLSDKNDKNPTVSFIFNEEEWLKKIALRLFFDFEGFISPTFTVKKKNNAKNKKFQFQFNAQLGLSIPNKFIAKEMEKITKSFKILMYIRKDRRCKSNIGGLITDNRNFIVRFNEIGGFLTGVKVSSKDKTEKPISKQTILETCLKILRTKSCSKYFNSREEAESYRNSFKKNILNQVKNGGPGRI